MISDKVQREMMEPYAMRKAMGKDGKPFQIEIDNALSRADEIKKFSTMVEKARELLGKHGIEAIKAMNREEMETVADPYDPAVMAALIELVEKDKQKAN